MTARQRQAPGSSAAPIPAEAPEADRGLNGEHTDFRWEAWFAAASPDQRAEALALARQQGLLYPHQLPKAANAARSESSLIPLLGRIFGGKAGDLAPVGDEATPWADAQLDPMQCEAVRRALNTPDVLLLQGIPGAGKSRVVTEVIIQAAFRGWRVLLI